MQLLVYVTSKKDHIQYHYTDIIIIFFYYYHMPFGEIICIVLGKHSFRTITTINQAFRQNPLSCYTVYVDVTLTEQLLLSAIQSELQVCGMQLAFHTRINC